LEGRDILLDFDLFFRMVLDVVADLSRVVQVDVAHLGDVEARRDDDVKTLGQGKEEKRGFNCDIGHDRFKFIFDCI